MSNLSYAIAYAERGWKVLPVGFNKKPLNSNGSRGASSDPQQINDWWKAHPKANVGLATGSASGLWVVDVDMKNDKNGYEALKSHFGSRLDFDINKHLFQKTASGGLHFLFATEGREIHNAQGVLSGVDIRGEGGYIVVSPSVVNIEGKWKHYEWNDPAIVKPISPILPWADELTRMSGTIEHKAKTSLQAIVTGLGEGQRDDGIFRFASMLKREQIAYPLAEAFVRTAASICVPPFDEAVAVDKVKRVYSQVEESPAQVTKRLMELVKRKK